MAENSPTKADRWDARYAASDLVWSASPNPFFAELIAHIAPGSALDLACGEGRNALWLAEQGWQVDAVDFSTVGIDKARQIAVNRGVSVNFQVSDVMQMADGSRYDLVSIVYLHTSQGERAIWLPSALDRVKPGGHLVYVGHDPRNIEEGAGGPQDPALLPSIDELSTLMMDFEVITGEVRERKVSADTGHGGTGDISLDTVLLARKHG